MNHCLYLTPPFPCFPSFGCHNKNWQFNVATGFPNRYTKNTKKIVKLEPRDLALTSKYLNSKNLCAKLLPSLPNPLPLVRCCRTGWLRLVKRYGFLGSLWVSNIAGPALCGCRRISDTDGLEEEEFVRWSVTFGSVTLDDCWTDNLVWSSNGLNHLPGWPGPTRAGRIDWQSRRWFSVSASGSAGSSLGGVSFRLLSIFSMWVSVVIRSSSVSCCLPSTATRASLAALTIRSQTPPKCGAAGRLKYCWGYIPQPTICAWVAETEVEFQAWGDRRL